LPAPKCSPRAAAFGLMLAGLAVGLALAEWVLAPLLLPPPAYYVKPPGQTWTSEPGDGELPGVYGNAWLRFNADGLRAEPADEADGYRILCIGGSTTECLVLDDSEAWPRLVQDRLRAAAPDRHAWVGGAGMPGGSARHHSLVMNYVLPRLPHIDTVVHLIGFNDAMYRFAADSEYRSMTPEEALTDTDSLDLAFLEYPGRRAGLPWFKCTNLWRLGRQAKRGWKHLSVMDGTAPLSGLSYAEQIAKLHERRRTVMTVRETMPDLTAALQDYERDLRYLIQQGREQQVRTVFLTQPTLWHEGMTPEEDAQLRFGDIGRDAYEATEYYRTDLLIEGMRQYNELTRKVCGNEGIECLDLAALVPRDLDHFYDDCHYNETGAVTVADAVADYLKSRPPFAEGATQVTESVLAR